MDPKNIPKVLPRDMLRVDTYINMEGERPTIFFPDAGVLYGRLGETESIELIQVGVGEEQHLRNLVNRGIRKAELNLFPETLIRKEITPDQDRIYPQLRFSLVNHKSWYPK
ncbi:hypothetical protein J4481_01155 [Candidatus Pacearchaeota archaeon]|nr:hypothetical protein [Candidatus Pacearchaeota archaeon]